MHSTYLLTSLAAFTALTSAHPSYPAPAVLNHPPSLVDLDVAAIVPILNNADVEVLELERRRAMNTDKGDLSNDGLVLLKREDKAARGLAGIEVSVGVDVSLKVNNLLKDVLSTLDPVFLKIEDVISHADDYTTEELSHVLSESFGRIHKATSGLSSSLNRIGGGFLERSRSKSLFDDSNNRLESRGQLISNEEVAETLSLLLNKVAGVVNLAQGLTGKLPVLGGILLPLFAQINGDLSLILSSVGNLLVGVVSLVKNLLDGVLGTVTGLPILGSLLGGLLGGLL